MQVPIIGNHESSDGDGSFRYLNQTFGMIYANPLNGIVSSATSALSHLLTKGSYLAPGLHGTTPSGTSSYFSVDIGLIHITVISNAIEHNDRSPAELAWLTKDLEAANKRRKEVPWIIVTSHYPIFKPEKEGQTANASLLGWYSEAGETCVDGVCAGSEYMSCEVAGEEEGCRTVAERVDETSSAIGTLFQRYGVDIYNAGHSHEYDVTWPMLTGKQALYQQNFSNPQGTVYVTEGNGAVPGTGPNATLSFLNASYPYGRVHGTGGAYGIITTASSDELTYGSTISPTNHTAEFVPALQRPDLSAGVFVIAQVRACLEQWPRRQGGGDGYLVAHRGHTCPSPGSIAGSQTPRSTTDTTVAPSSIAHRVEVDVLLRQELQPRRRRSTR